MLSHVVLFWTKPGVERASERLIECARNTLAKIPGLLGFHIGVMVPSERAVVDQSYQVGLLIQLPDKAAEAAYQTHPLHIEFVEGEFKQTVDRVRVYDFADPR